MFDNATTTDDSLDLQQILDATHDAVVIINAENRICYFNASAESLWGYQAAEVMGKNVRLLIPTSMRSSHDDWVNRHRRDGQDRIVGDTREVQLERKDGTLLWVSLGLLKTVGPDGQNF